MKIMLFEHLKSNERRTFLLHLTYMLLEGVLAGLILLNEFVFLKSMNGSDTLMAVLFQSSVILLIFSIFFNQALKQIRNKRRLLVFTGIFTRMPLFALLFFPTDLSQYVAGSVYHVVFLCLFFIYYFANPVIFPTINLLLKLNYSHQNFGKLYSYATSLRKSVALVSVFIFGMLYDNVPYAFVYVYPSMGVLGIISIVLLSLINYEEKDLKPVKKSYFTMVKESWTNMIRVIKINKPYRDFEIGFMLYGFAFMTSVTVINIFMVKVLDLSFTSIAFYKNLFNILAILILPFVGKLIGHTDPRKFAIYTYLAKFLYILFIALTQFYAWNAELFGIQIYFLLLIGFIMFGVFTANMALLWNVGSAYFCSNEEAAHYQSIHLTLTGIRAMFAPFVGVALYQIIGYWGVFALCNAALLAAMIVQHYSMKRHINQPVTV